MDFSFKDVQLYPTSINNFFDQLTGGHVSLPSGFGKEILVGIFILFTLFYLAVSVVLFYHWHVYGMKNRLILATEVVFLAVSLALFFAAFIILFTI